MPNNRAFFGIDFYPTPREVVEQMLADTDVSGKMVLEPSAGSGNIVDILNERGAAEVFACELDPSLRRVLQGRCTLIGEDFLKLTPEDVSHIDVCIMNPPFSHAEDHILHAYDILPEGCEIISLCNFETTVNHWSVKRSQLKEIIENNGFSDDYGECFSTADRKTGCRIACIHLWKPRTGKDEFADYFSFVPEEEQRIQAEGIIGYNPIREIVNRYTAAVSKYDAVIAASEEINSLTSVFTDCAIRFGAYDPNTKENRTISRAQFKKQLQKAAWREIFKRMDMEKYVTRSIREDINRFVERQTNVPFTVRNIFRMIELVFMTHGDRMQETLTQAFDMICSFSAENSTAGEKWKTNSDYMINRRFIVPYITDYDSRWPTDHVKLQWGSTDKLDDITKALCYLTGTPYENTARLYESVTNRDIPWGEWATMTKTVTTPSGEKFTKTGFFRIRGYKKGTMHFEFLDEDVWAKFNAEVARIRGWQLPKPRKNRPSKKEVRTTLFD